MGADQIEPFQSTSIRVNQRPLGIFSRMHGASETRREGSGAGGLLGLVERLGNRLPDPLLLFVLATVLVVVISALGSGLGWSVQPVRPQMISSGAAGPRVELVAEGAPIRPRSLATGEGVYWLGANLVRNFINFPPLGVVLVCMLAIGLAEHTGMFASAMRYLGGVVPAPALTPAVIMLGFLSHMAADSGFVVLPPLAAALYAACGRSPIVGAAVAYAAVAGGFSANLMVS